MDGYIAAIRPPNLNFTVAIFTYDVDLPSTFLADASTSYWLSVFAFSPPPGACEAQWGRTGGTGGNGTSVQSGNVVNFDRAFSLTTVPEPATLALLGLGLAGLGFSRRKQ